MIRPTAKHITFTVLFLLLLAAGTGTLLAFDNNDNNSKKQDFVSLPIPDSVWTLMQGKSYKDNPYIRRSDLRYLRVLHVDDEGQVPRG